jgi:hypothetical protein
MRTNTHAKSLALPPRVDDDDREDVMCPRLLNGLYAIAGHCQRCDNAIRACKPRTYRVWDHNHNVIVGPDWLTA